MSAIAEPPVQSAPAVPPAAPPPIASNLPGGIVVDHNHNADGFFEKHVAENPDHPAHKLGLPAKAAAVAPVEQKPLEVAAPVAPAAEPKPKGTDIGSQLADRFIPEAAKPHEAAPAAVAAPAASDNPEDKIQLTSSASPAAHESFKAMKAVAGGLRNQLIARERELQDAKQETERVKAGAVTVDSPEITKLKAENEAMSKRLLVLDVQNHPRFQAEVIAPRQQAVQEAQNILDAAGVAGVDVNAILAKDAVGFRKELSAVAAKLPTGLDQNDFANAMRTAHALKIKADTMVSNASELSQNLRQQTLQNQTQAFERVYSSTIGSIQGIAELVAPAGTSAEDIQRIEGFNQGVRSMKQRAETYALKTSNPEDIGRAAIKAAAYDWQTQHVVPMMGQLIKAKDSRIAELEQQLSGIRSRNPNRQISGSPDAAGGVDPSKMGHKEAAEYFATRGNGRI